MRYDLQGEARFAKFDMGNVRIHQAQHIHTPSWRGVYNYLLKHYDYDAAELVKVCNMVSDECSEDAHDLCFFSWCTCSHHSGVQFALEHPQLRSLSERGEQEGD